jgi:hypothetical protein
MHNGRGIVEKGVVVSLETEYSFLLVLGISQIHTQLLLNIEVHPQGHDTGKSRIHNAIHGVLFVKTPPTTPFACIAEIKVVFLTYKTVQVSFNAVLVTSIAYFRAISTRDSHGILRLFFLLGN